jgi:hypothetical protein
MREDKLIRKRFFFEKLILHEFVQGNNLHLDRLDRLVQDNILVHRIDIDDDE